MPSKRRKKPSTAAEACLFWAVVLVIASIFAFISFRVGRDWLGKRLGSVEMDPGAPRIVAEVNTDAESAARLEQENKAPKSVQPMVEDREPTDAEKLRIERERATQEPQDGAQLNSDETDESPPDETDSAEEPAESAPAEPARRGFTVTAGAFTDAANAARTVSKLAARGYRPYTEKITKDGKVLHRVNVAVVQDRAKAEQLRDELVGLEVSAGIIAGQ